jgi:hypothetical protein
LAFFSGCTASPNSKARALAWPLCSASFSVMAAEFGRKASAGPGRLFTLVCQNPCRWLNLTSATHECGPERSNPHLTR